MHGLLSCQSRIIGNRRGICSYSTPYRNYLLEYLILTCLVAPQLQKVVVRGGFEEDGPSPLSSIMRMPDKEFIVLPPLSCCVNLNENIEMYAVY